MSTTVCDKNITFLLKTKKDSLKCFLDNKNKDIQNVEILLLEDIIHINIYKKNQVVE